ncbi:hypothetical protein [Haloterrigena alkaliphila]|uniref:Lipoprotein n=1 Tax=Haloterrigena alkaliphila TaxID=2816475 RepID=A0A8A2VPM6_9EURY|nr:hypothetical protein [Haloterrigena alkaliphila]QSX00059.1 hypothetical protein J0X25_03575 [Haloterrigena alkaliphila]
MERRKILLGSGAALATALAGCSDSETSDDTPDTDGGNGSNETKNGNGNGNGNGTDPEDDTNETDERNVDDVPGFDGTKLDLETDAVEITKIERKGDAVDVVATSEVTDREKLYAELESFADDHDEAAVDLEAFADAIHVVEWTLEHDGSQVASFSVHVSWLVDYREGDLSKEEFLEYVKDTAE